MDQLLSRQVRGRQFLRNRHPHVEPRQPCSQLTKQQFPDAAKNLKDYANERISLAFESSAILETAIAGLPIRKAHMGIPAPAPICFQWLLRPRSRLHLHSPWHRTVRLRIQ